MRNSGLLQTKTKQNETKVSNSNEKENGYPNVIQSQSIQSATRKDIYSFLSKKKEGVTFNRRNLRKKTVTIFERQASFSVVYCDKVEFFMT